MIKITSLIVLLIACPSIVDVHSSWDEWWTYDGISGPNFWGRLNPKWSLCSKGRRQSPINIDPSLLLFDPSLPLLTISGSHVNGHLINTGRGIVFKVSTTNDKELILPKFLTPTNNAKTPPPSSSLSSGTSWQLIPPDGKSGDANLASKSSSASSTSSLASSNLASSQSSSSLPSNEPVPLCTLEDGPLSYRYTLSHITFHYGRQLNYGSEHLIDGHQFPGEVQLYFYNSQLYSSFEDAASKSHGVAAIGIMIQVSTDSKLSNPQLKRITHALKNITSKGSSQYVNALNMNELINLAPSNNNNNYNYQKSDKNNRNVGDGPLNSNSNKQYVTYEGSLTEPGCYETVSWIILNKPIYMTSHLFHSLIHSMSSETSHHSADNFRPTQKLNSRSIRTNIDFKLNQQNSFVTEVSSMSSNKNNDDDTSDNGDDDDDDEEGSRDNNRNNDGQPKRVDVDLNKYQVKGSLSNNHVGSTNKVTTTSKKVCSMKRPVSYKANIKSSDLID